MIIWWNFGNAILSCMWIYWYPLSFLKQSLQLNHLDMLCELLLGWYTFCFFLSLLPPPQEGKISYSMNKKKKHNLDDLINKASTHQILQTPVHPRTHTCHALLPRRAMIDLRRWLWSELGLQFSEVKEVLDHCWLMTIRQKESAGWSALARAMVWHASHHALMAWTYDGRTLWWWCGGDTFTDICTHMQRWS